MQSAMASNRAGTTHAPTVIHGSPLPIVEPVASISSDLPRGIETGRSNAQWPRVFVVLHNPLVGYLNLGTGLAVHGNQAFLELQ